jgi:hypothetical protein
MSRWDLLLHSGFGPLEGLGKFKVVGRKCAQLVGDYVVSRLRGHFQTTFCSAPIFYRRRHELLQANHENITAATLRSFLPASFGNGARVRSGGGPSCSLLDFRFPLSRLNFLLQPLRTPLGHLKIIRGEHPKQRSRYGDCLGLRGQSPTFFGLCHWNLPVWHETISDLP